MEAKLLKVIEKAGIGFNEPFIINHILIGGFVGEGVLIEGKAPLPKVILFYNCYWEDREDLQKELIEENYIVEKS